MSYDPRSDEDRQARRQQSRDRGTSPALAFLLVALGILLGAAAFWAGGQFLARARKEPPPNNPDAKLREVTPRAPLDGDETEAVDLFKKLRPSVVNVDLVQIRRSGWDDRPAEQQTGAGSGFIWDDDGRIITNYHVVADLRSRANMTVRVVLADRGAYDAVVVGAAPDWDLAVLQFAPHNFPPKDKVQKIEVGSSHDLEVGQKVFAIGNPYGLSLTMTKGIISALDRTIESPARTPITGVIQTDAAINPGNSGGPLLDKSGRLIGVNTAISTPTAGGGNVGIGFAIPVDTVNQVVTQIIQSGRVLRPDLGIKLYDQQELRRKRYDHGVMIWQTTPNGPAANAGLQGLKVNRRTGEAEPGDLIVAINGEKIDTVEDYSRAVRKLKPGEQAKLKIIRRDVEQEVTLTVGGV